MTLTSGLVRRRQRTTAFRESPGPQTTHLFPYGKIWMHAGFFFFFFFFLDFSGFLIFVVVCLQRMSRRSCRRRWGYASGRARGTGNVEMRWKETRGGEGASAETKQRRRAQKRVRKTMKKMTTRLMMLDPLTGRLLRALQRRRRRRRL